MSITVTRTERSIVVVSDQDFEQDEWLDVCREHDLLGRHLSVDDYSTDGTRHYWQFTILPVHDTAEVTQ